MNFLPVCIDHACFIKYWHSCIKIKEDRYSTKYYKPFYRVSGTVVSLCIHVYVYLITV